MITFDEWFSSLPKERQKVLREDKWMLANAAFEHAQAERDALADKVQNLIKGDWTPEQYHSIIKCPAIADHDTEVAKAAFIAGIDWFCVDGEFELSEGPAEQYAAQLRTKAKP